MIILVNPKGGPWQSDESLGLDYIASALDKQGEDVIVFNLHNRDIEELRYFLINETITYVGITIMHATTVNALYVASIVKSIQPNVPVVVGGVTATTSWKELLENPNIDIVVIGEGEITANEIISVCRGEIDLNDVSGIAFRCNGIPIQTSKKLPIEDLDSLAWPRRAHGKKSYSILTSRGCPGYCIYCSSPTLMGRKYRARSVESVLAELAQLITYTSYRPLNIIVADDNFAHDLERAILICNGIAKQKWDITLTVGNGIRVDKVNKELLIALKKAGCRFLAFGIESGSQYILDKMGKGISLAQIRNAVSLAKDVGVPILANFMIGNIEETEETVLESIKFCSELDTAYVTWSLAVDYPGTGLYNWVTSHGKRLSNRKDAAHSDSKHVAFITDSLSSRKRRQLRSRALRMYYRQRLFSIIKLNQPVWNLIRLLGTVNIHSSNRILKKIVVACYSFLNQIHTKNEVKLNQSNLNDINK